MFQHSLHCLSLIPLILSFCDISSSVHCIGFTLTVIKERNSINRQKIYRGLLCFASFSLILVEIWRYLGLRTTSSRWNSYFRFSFLPSLPFWASSDVNIINLYCGTLSSGVKIGRRSFRLFIQSANDSFHMNDAPPRERALKL